MSSGLETVRLRHRALPERPLESVSLRTVLLGRVLDAPLVVSAMAGGTGEAEAVNRRLTRAAAVHGVGLVLRSGRRLHRDRDTPATFRPQGDDRPPLLLADLGATQIVGQEGTWRAERLVELMDADGLSIHLNPLQEALQPRGQPDFSGVLGGIEAAVARIAPRPVVVSEAGFGLDHDDLVALRSAGVAAIDVAGAGGIDGSLVAGRRDEHAESVAGAFTEWGVRTASTLTAAFAAAPDLPIIASGGLRDGVDVAKCLALGATAGGISGVFLLAAQANRAAEAIGAVVEQLRIATWLAGAPSAQELGREHLQ